MPNFAQVLFLSSFAVTFALLYYLSTLAGAYLRAHGWDVNDIILIGLEKKDLGSEPPQKLPSMAALVEALSTDRTAQVALLAGVAGSIFVLTRFFAPSQFYLSLSFECLSYPTVERKPVLDPQEWKEFPLIQKIIVSPNTALWVVLCSCLSLRLTLTFAAIASACPVPMMCSASQLVSTSLSKQRLTERKLHEATHPQVVTTTLVISTCS